MVGGPEARGIRGQQFVGQHQAVVLVESELELGVGDDDAARTRVVGRQPVQHQAHPAYFLGAFGAEQLHRLFEVDVLVVIADGGLGGGGVDRFRQLLGLLQARGQLDAADLAGLLVILPARADQVAAHDGLHRQRAQPLDDDRAVLEPFVVIGVEDIAQVHLAEMVGNQVLRLVKPEVGDPRQQLALAGYRVGHDHVEGGDAVGGDEQQVAIVDLVDVAHLAAGDQRQVEMGFLNGLAHVGQLPGGEKRGEILSQTG